MQNPHPYDPIYEIFRPYPIDGESRFREGDLVELQREIQFIPVGTRGEVEGYAEEGERAKGRTWSVSFVLTAQESRQWRESIRGFAPRLIDLLGEDTVSIRANLHPDDIRLVNRVASALPELGLMSVKERRCRMLVAAISGKPVRFHSRLLALSLYEVLLALGFRWDTQRKFWVNELIDDTAAIVVQQEGEKDGS